MRRMNGSAIIGVLILVAVFGLVAAVVINQKDPSPPTCPVCGVTAPCYNHS